jgi:hypothetical protein
VQRPGFFHGIAAFYAGVGFVATTPRLWLRAAMPIASLLAVGSGLGLGGVWLSVRAADHLAGGPGFLAESGHFLVALSLSLVAVAIAAVVGLTLAQPLSSSALDGLAQAQAEALHLPPWPVQSRGASLGRSLRSALVGTGAWLIATAVLGLVGLPATGGSGAAAPAVASAGKDERHHVGGAGLHARKCLGRDNMGRLAEHVREERWQRRRRPV